MKYATITLPYYKQGSDLSGFLDSCSTISEALKAHARMLEGAVSILRDVDVIISTEDIEIYADTHHIGISGPDEVIDRLIESGCAEIDEDDEDDGYDDNVCSLNLG